MNVEESRRLALAFIEREVEAGNLTVNYPQIAEYLTKSTGEKYSVGQVAGLLSRLGKRKSN